MLFAGICGGFLTEIESYGIRRFVKYFAPKMSAVHYKTVSKKGKISAAPINDKG